MIIRLEVGEPWDFSGPDGDNTILVKSKVEGCGLYGDWIICTCKPFLHNRVTISSLLLSKRHTNSLITDLRNGKSILMNAYWRKNGELWDKQAVANAETDSSIIGGWLIVSGQIMKP